MWYQVGVVDYYVDVVEVGQCCICQCLYLGGIGYIGGLDDYFVFKFLCQCLQLVDVMCVECEFCIFFGQQFGGGFVEVVVGVGNDDDFVCDICGYG